jgi:hypothetical protein
VSVQPFVGHDFPLRVEIAPGVDPAGDPSTWTFVDITAWVRVASGINIRVGRPDEATQVTPGECGLVVDNRDGRFSPRKIGGPYFHGILDRNTPVRIMLGGSVEYCGFVSSWPSRWDLSGNDAWVPIAGAGVLRRLNQGRPPRRSAVVRTALGSSQQLAAFWPCEDRQGSPSAASLVAGVAPMVPLSLQAWQSSAGIPIPSGNTPKFEAGEGTAGSGRLPSYTDGGSLTGFPRVDLGNREWTIQWVMQFEKDKAPATNVIAFSFDADGSTYPYYTVEVTATGVDVINADALSGGTIGFVEATVNVYDGTPHFFSYRARQVGSNISAELWVDGASWGAPSVYAGAGTVRPISKLATNSFQDSVTDGPSMPVALGEFMVWPYWDVVAETERAAFGWVTEGDADRVQRLCDEEGVPIDLAATGGEEMGPQPIGTFTELLFDAEAAGRSFLAEGTNFGFRYLPRAARYNQASALDLTASQLLAAPEPEDDDQRLRNQWTVSRASGGDEATVTADDIDPTSTLRASRVGIYEDSATVNVYAEGRARQHAGWRVGEGIVDAQRWPSLTVDLLGDFNTLAVAWQNLTLGDRATLSGLPSQAGPGPEELTIEGWTLRIGYQEWRADIVTAPDRAWTVGVLDDPVLGLLDDTMILAL